jgi:excisionase family DNA binding protein
MALKVPEENIFRPVSPSEKDQQVAKISAQRLATALRRKKSDFHFELDDESFAVPESVTKMLLEILSQMAQGNAVVLIPAHAELTTQEAADTLNVSRPFLIKLLEQGKLPYRKVGSHRRVMFSDLMNYKEQYKNDRLKVLEELQKDAEDNDMGY